MKTIILDIETAPSLAYVWGVWKQNIGLPMMVQSDTYVMSCAIKTLGEDDIVYLENRTEDDSEIVRDICQYLDDADFVVAHNGVKFDIPIIKARAIVHDIKPPSPFKVIDTLKIAKKEFRFQRNSLEYLAITLDVPLQKLKHQKFPGFKLWSECIKQNDEAWNEMQEYNIRDIETLEQVYVKMRPWASQHPNVNSDTEETVMCCPKCGSIDLHKRGFFYTNKGKYQRYSCGGCGGWSSETYVMNTVEKRKSLIASR